MNDEKRVEVLDELARWSERPTIEPDEVTKHDVAARMGWTLDATRTWLDAQVENGRMTRRKVYGNSQSRWIYAYRLIAKA